MEKICTKCHKPFTPIKPEHTLCYNCWREGQRQCLRCGRIINDMPSNYKYCNDCFNKIYHG